MHKVVYVYMCTFDMAMIAGAFRSQCHPHTSLFAAGCVTAFWVVMNLFDKFIPICKASSTCFTA